MMQKTRFFNTGLIVLFASSGVALRPVPIAQIGS